MIRRKIFTKTGGKESGANEADIRKNFVRVTVKRWLKHNAHRFLHDPRITDVWKHGFCLKFRSITPQIALTIGYGFSFEIFVSEDKKTCWDYLADFDLAPRQDDAGRYYCGMVIEEYREFHSSLRELLEHDGLEVALAWVNEQLRPERWVCLFGEKNDNRWAELVDAGKLPECRKAKNFHAAFPVGVQRKSAFSEKSE